MLCKLNNSRRIYRVTNTGDSPGVFVFATVNLNFMWICYNLNRYWNDFSTVSLLNVKEEEMADKKGVTLAEEQKKFIERALAGKNIMLDGVSGSGRRTALKELCEKLPSKSKVLYFTNSRFFKNEVEDIIKKPNVLIDYYNGFAFRELRKIGVYGETDDLLNLFAKVKPTIKGYEYLIIGDFEDLTEEAAKMLEAIKSKIPNIKIIAYGDITHKASIPGKFNPRMFMEEFLDNYEKVLFKNCYVISSYEKGMRSGDDERGAVFSDEDDEDFGGGEETEGTKDKGASKSKKGSSKEDNTPETRIAVIDTEINRNDEVMSVGLVIADAETFDVDVELYYILEPEHSVGGNNSKALRINECVNADAIPRSIVMAEIRECLRQHHVRSLFAYNASADYERLPELSALKWYDIMQVAAYKQYNSSITDDDDCHGTGRLKRDFGVAAMLKRLTGDSNVKETNNALYDARDELKIMKLLGRPLTDYSVAALTDDVVEADIDWSDISGIETIEEDSLTTAEAEQLLGVSRGTVYNLIRRGEIFGYKRGQRYIISAISVREYLDRREATENFRYKAILMTVLLVIFFALIYLWHIAAKYY